MWRSKLKPYSLQSSTLLTRAALERILYIVGKSLIRFCLCFGSFLGLNLCVCWLPVSFAWILWCVELEFGMWGSVSWHHRRILCFQYAYGPRCSSQEFDSVFSVFSSVVWGWIRVSVGYGFFCCWLWLCDALSWIAAFSLPDSGMQLTRTVLERIPPLLLLVFFFFKNLIRFCLYFRTWVGVEFVWWW